MMLSYETLLFNKLRSASLADQPGTFVHGKAESRRVYTLLCFGEPSRLAYSELRHDARTRRWEVVEPYGVLQHCRAGDLVTAAWRRHGSPNLAVFQQHRWPYSGLTTEQRDDDRDRFITTSTALTTYSSVLRYYDRYQYAQVGGAGLYHLHGDSAKLGVPEFPDRMLQLGFGLVPSSVSGDGRPYTFGVWLGLHHYAPKSPHSLDGDLRFLVRG